MIHYIFASPILRNILTILIALVWLVNGLFCKVLNLVPRHRLIVAGILGDDHAALFTKLIGVSEVMMAAWILSNIHPHLCAIVQMAVVAVMNIIEFIKVPHLLLFGRINSIVAAFFIAAVYSNAFVLPQYINP